MVTLQRSDRFYLPMLDGYRFVAFALVFLSHTVPMNVADNLTSALAIALVHISVRGWMGVDLFLTLSGFLITSLLLRERDATGTIDVKRFYIRRILRIWPLYYLIVVAAFLVLPFAYGQIGTPAYERFLREHLLPYLTLFANTSYATYLSSQLPIRPSASILGPLWTISVEEQFYLVFPLVMAAAAPALTVRRATRCVVAAIIFSVGVRVYLAWNSVPHPMAATITLGHLDPIVLGILGAILWHRHADRVRAARLFGADLVLGLGLLGAIVVLGQYPGEGWAWTWRITCAGGGAVLLLMATLRYGWLGAALGWGPIRWLGRISYGLYVYHMVAYELYMRAVAPIFAEHLTGPISPIVVRFFVSLAFTIALATVSYYAFERPILRLKERLAVVPSRPS